MGATRTPPRIDINCDMGESFGTYSLGLDADIIPHVARQDSILPTLWI